MKERYKGKVWKDKRLKENVWKYERKGIIKIWKERYNKDMKGKVWNDAKCRMWDKSP